MISAAPADDLLAAGKAALARSAWDEARALFEEALRHQESPEALEGLSWAAWWLEDGTACLDAREGAYRGYRTAGDQQGAARMALWLSDDHVEFRGAPAVAAGWFARAARLLGDVKPCPEHGWLAVFDAHAALERHDLATAMMLLGQAQEIGRKQGAVDLEMFALASEGVARIEGGEVAHGLRCLDEATAAALGGEYENLVPAAWACCLALSSCERLRDFTRGAQWCEKVAEFSRRTGARFLMGVCRTHYGAIRGWHGGWEEAERELVAALRQLTANRPSWRPEALVRLGELRRQQGRHAEAASLFDQAPEHPLAQRGRAALSLDQGEPAVARDLLERALRRIPSSRDARRADFLELLVRAQLAMGDAEAAAARLEELRVVAAAVPTEPLRAAVSVTAGLVAAATGDHEQACDHFEDAIDVFDGRDAPLEASRTRIELACVLTALDRRQAARREAEVARACLAELGAAVELARVDVLLGELDGPHGPSPLTSRQVQVLSLVAEGLSDQEIADRLVISEHTVHRHVANIYTRLGCSSRAAAVALAGRLGLL